MFVPITNQKTRQQQQVESSLTMLCLITNDEYTIMIKIYNKDLNIYYITGTGMWIEGYNTKTVSI